MWTNIHPNCAITDTDSQEPTKSYLTWTKITLWLSIALCIVQGSPRQKALRTAKGISSKCALDQGCKLENRNAVKRKIIWTKTNTLYIKVKIPYSRAKMMTPGSTEILDFLYSQASACYCCLSSLKLSAKNGFSATGRSHLERHYNNKKMNANNTAVAKEINKTETNSQPCMQAMAEKNTFFIFFFTDLQYQLLGFLTL